MFMFIEWLTPLLEWLGIGLVPFLILFIAVILLIKD